MIKKVIFTVSKNNNLSNWQEYHLSKDFEIYVVDNGNIEYFQNDKFHIIKPDYSEDVLGHVNQQEYLMNMFYKCYKKDALIYFIDDDEYIVENEPIKDNTYLNWKIFNKDYYPITNLNMYFKPVVKTNQNILLKIHNIFFLNDSIDNIVRDGNNNIINSNIQFIKEQSFKNYIIHYQYTSIDNFNNKLLIRPSYEKLKYFKIRLNGFYECINMKTFHMCVILDNYDKIEILRKIYPRITFFIITSIIPQGADMEIIPYESLNCPEQYIFKYAEENSLDIIIKKASKINTDIIDIKDEYKNINMNKILKHYNELNQLKYFKECSQGMSSRNVFKLIDIKSYKDYGLFNYLDIVKMNQFIKKLDNISFESKSFKILLEMISILENI